MLRMLDTSRGLYGPYSWHWGMLVMMLPSHASDSATELVLAITHQGAATDRRGAIVDRPGALFIEVSPALVRVSPSTIRVPSPITRL
jgi:hypothetical protein